MNAIVIAITMAKGGVGKTTSTLTLSAGLSARGYRVLMIDCDCQANLTEHSIHCVPDVSINEVILRQVSKMPIHNVKENLFLLPANHNLFSLAWHEDLDKAGIIKDVVDPLRKHFDFILLDCPPGGDVLTVASLIAADYVLLPVQAQTYAYLDACWYYDLAVRQQAMRVNPKLKLLGVLVTMYDKNISSEKAIYDAVHKRFPEGHLKSYIRHSNYFKSASLNCVDVFEWAPRSNAAYDYGFTVDEILRRLGMPGAKAGEGLNQ